MVDMKYSTVLQVRFDNGALNRARNRKKSSCRLLRPSWCRGAISLRKDFWFRARQLQKSPRFVGDLAEVAKPKTLSDNVEEIAMLAGCRVGLMFNCT